MIRELYSEKSRIFGNQAGHLLIIWSKRTISAVYALVGQFASSKKSFDEWLDQQS